MEISNEKDYTINQLASSLKTAANRADVSIGYLRKEIRQGNLKAKKFGAKVSILEADFLKWLESKEDWQPQN